MILTSCEIESILRIKMEQKLKKCKTIMLTFDMEKNHFKKQIHTDKKFIKNTSTGLLFSLQILYADCIVSSYADCIVSS